MTASAEAGPGGTAGEISLGLDVGGTKTHGLVLDAANRVLAEEIAPTGSGPYGVRASALGVARLLSERLGGAGFASVGVGIPGLVDARTGLVETAVNLGITRTNVSELLADAFDATVRVENDVKATALGIGAVLGGGIRDLCHVNVGTGLAAAAVSNGRVVRGARNAAGEIGHFAVDPAGVLCRCGQRGCLETMCGGSFVTARLGELGLDLATLDEDDDPRAADERARIVAALVTAVTLVVTTYDSSVVVLGGGVVAAAPWLVPAVRDELGERARASLFLAGMDIAGRIAVLPDDVPVAAIGAAVVGRKHGLRSARR